MKLVTYRLRRAVNSVRHRTVVLLAAGAIAALSGFSDINLLATVLSQVLP